MWYKEETATSLCKKNPDGLASVRGDSFQIYKPCYSLRNKFFYDNLSNKNVIVLAHGATPRQIIEGDFCPEG